MSPSIAEVFADCRQAGATAVTAWPDGAAGAALRLTVDGGTVAGRWYAEAEQAAAAAEPGTTVRGRIVLHADGVDRRLPALAPAVAAGAQLIAHRVGKRAVLRTSVGYRKFVRPSKLAGLRSAVDRTAALPVATPAVLRQDQVSLTLSPLPGQALHDRIRAGEVTPGDCVAVGQALARLHAAPLPTGTPVHDSAAELAVTRRWTELASRWGAGPARDLQALLPLPPARPVLLHRDLHDKQILLDGGEVALLDFDLAAAGDPALDLANLVEHLWLRRRQGLPLDAAACEAAVLDGYRPDERTRAALPFHRLLTRHRLAAVYAFRSVAP